MIDAKLAQEKMHEMRNMIDMRFGPGTWQTIVDERAKRIREEKERIAEIKREKIRKQREFEESAKQFAVAAIVAVGMIGLLGFAFYQML